MIDIIYKQPHQDLGLYGFSFGVLCGKVLHPNLYRALNRDAGALQRGTDMAAVK